MFLKAAEVHERIVLKLSSFLWLLQPVCLWHDDSCRGMYPIHTPSDHMIPIDGDTLTCTDAHGEVLVLLLLVHAA